MLAARLTIAAVACLVARAGPAGSTARPVPRRRVSTAMRHTSPATTTRGATTAIGTNASPGRCAASRTVATVASTVPAVDHECLRSQTAPNQAATARTAAMTARVRTITTDCP